MVQVRYNLVVLPVGADAAGGRLYELSAGSPGRPRLVAQGRSEAEVRETLAALGASAMEAEELLRGNNMPRQRRSTLWFTPEALEAAGLALLPEPVVAAVAEV